MDDDLIPTAEVARLLGRSVATINRWAQDGREGFPQPALKLPGRLGVRLYRRADVEALTATQPPACRCDTPDLDDLDACRNCKRKPAELLRRPA